ncbi:DUF4158 domain-containing protein [Nonomuraea sp. NPDC049646]|uniref:DUF4158 domain-containing protein n=1 Tax=unclassified Nonomuraea TaxID=2593643 RepID=UPI00378B93CF
MGQGSTRCPTSPSWAGSSIWRPADRRRAMAANGARNQLGWAVQLGTARFLNCFLEDPEDVPAVVVDYVAEQLCLDPSVLKGADRAAGPGHSPFGQGEDLASRRHHHGADDFGDP